jgi:hypothetical protein
MKTFNELILWELQQEANQNSSNLSLSEEHGNGKLSASVLRKLRHLKTPSVGAKPSLDGLSPA